MTTNEQTTAAPAMDANDVARLAIDVASDRQATDIVLLDVSEVSGFADFMVIMSVGSARQLNAVANELEGAIVKAGAKMHHREGTDDSGWVLLDFGDVVLHVFSEQQRDFYKLEQVWKAGKQIVRIQ